MSDELSFSDWESVSDDFQRPKDNDAKQEETKQKIVVEMPPEGICSSRAPASASASASEPPAEEGGRPSSILSHSVMKKIGDLQVKSDVSASSSTSSFIPVSRFAEMKIPTSATSSLVGNEAPAGSSSLSNVSSHPLCAGWTVISSNTSVSSIISNFDILASPSGETVKRCKRCKYHNTPDCTICQMCDLALVANPCLDIDAQIAARLQQKYESEALNMIQEKERKRNRLESESLLTQSEFFYNELKSYFQVNRFEASGFNILSEYHMKFLISGFIGKTLQLDAPKVSFEYIFVDRGDLEKVKSLGFPATFHGCVEVSNDLETAAGLFSERGMKCTDATLYSIPEYKSESFETRKSHGWIIATVESLEEPAHRPLVTLKGAPTSIRVGSGHHVKRFENKSQVLPLAYFDSDIRSSSEVGILFRGLSELCYDFFGHSLNLKTDTVPRPPSKKLKLPDTVTSQGDKRATRNTKTTQLKKYASSKHQSGGRPFGGCSFDQPTHGGPTRSAEPTVSVMDIPVSPISSSGTSPVCTEIEREKAKADHLRILRFGIESDKFDAAQMERKRQLTQMIDLESGDHQLRPPERALSSSDPIIVSKNEGINLKSIDFQLRHAKQAASSSDPLLLSKTQDEKNTTTFADKKYDSEDNGDFLPFESVFLEEVNFEPVPLEDIDFKPDNPDLGLITSFFLKESPLHEQKSE